MDQPRESKHPARRRYVFECPICGVVMEAPLEGLTYDDQGCAVKGVGRATCPNGHTIELDVGSLREAK